MFRLVLAVAFIQLTSFVFCQSNYQFVVKDSLTQEAIIGVKIQLKNQNIGGVTDLDGKLILQLPSGGAILLIQASNYISKELVINASSSKEQVILLTPQNIEMDEIIVEGTRSNKSIDDSPTRVEVLTEEIDEASTMDPSKIAHLITHSTGIQVQQTSATSNTANVRIQGLDGRYTQILKDGFPLFGGFSGSLSIMQIPPLDLRQVEYIKGGASTLFGGGAISGLINLLSKDPQKEEMLFHINASHVGAFDVNAFVSKKTDKIGFTLLGQRNSHAYFDADKDGFTDLPQLLKYNLNPKLFFYINPKNTLMLGGTFTEETRQGGDVRVLKTDLIDTNHFYNEQNKVNRITTQLKFDHKINANQHLTFRNSFNFFNRVMQINPSKALTEIRFGGNQVASFSELSYTLNKKKHVFITGLNYYTDEFKEERRNQLIFRDEQLYTSGFFVNYSGNITDKFALETGFRGDFVSNNEFHALPRVGASMKWTKKFTTRIGGGMGYRNPTNFSQEAEIRTFDQVLPINYSLVKSEKSTGGNIDFGYKTTFGEHFFITFNQLFFITEIENPIALKDTGNLSGVYQFVNIDGKLQSYGAETFFKFGFYDFVLFVGYTYTHATNQFSGTSSYITLTPQHSLKGDLLYALPGKWRIGVDYEYKSRQYLNNGTFSKDFWTYGLVIEYTNNKVTYFANVENFTNFRQTAMQSLISLPENTPQYTDVWAPLDGIVVNAGLKFRL